MNYILIIFYFFTSILCGQNRFEKHIDASLIETVTIRLDLTSKLVLKTSAEPKLKLSTISEGEYGQQIALVVDQKDQKETVISDVLQPTFDTHNDKLSVHKVHAVTTTITLPKNLLVTVEMISGKIALAGHYKQVFIKSDAANITMSYNSGDTTILSKTGTIKVAIKKTIIKSVTNTDISTHIITKNGNNILLKTVLGKISIE